MAGVLLMAVNPVIAQKTDTSSVLSPKQKHSSRKALLFSAIIPGLGQAYNQKYWKIPIIYGAGGAFVYYVGYNQIMYRKFRNALLNGKKGSRTYIDGRYFDFESLPRGRDYYRRYRDISVFGTAAIYFLNIVDAMIDAEFFNYDVSDDLTLHIKPEFFSPVGMTSSIGLRIDIVF